MKIQKEEEVRQESWVTAVQKRGTVERKVHVRSEELGHEGAVLLGREGEANQEARKMETTKLRQEARRGALAAPFSNSHPAW